MRGLPFLISDSLVGFSNIEGSAHADRLIDSTPSWWSSFRNCDGHFRGLDGDDTLNAGYGDDTLEGGADADRFVFGLDHDRRSHGARLNRDDMGRPSFAAIRP